jgi:plasmid stabilization system protein ParE
MNRPLIIRPDAEADIWKIDAELEMVRQGLGRRFAAQLNAELERIESLPELRGIVWRDVRAVRIMKFQYVVYYVAYDDRVEVIAVMHGARDSTAWQSRSVGS